MLDRVVFSNLVLSADGGETIALDVVLVSDRGERTDGVATLCARRDFSRGGRSVLHSKAMFCHECGKRTPDQATLLPVLRHASGRC